MNWAEAIAGSIPALARMQPAGAGDTGTTLAEQRRIMRARRSLLDFTKYTFDGDFAINWHHRLLAERLEAFARGEIKRLIVCMPPRHGKSELASRRLPAWLLGRDPNTEIIATSYGKDLALDMSRDTKRIVQSEAYARVFPRTKLPGANVVTSTKSDYKNTADQWQVVGYRGQYLARGVGGGITGKGGKFLIIDDPIKDDVEAQSSTVRDKIWNWYSKVLKTRASKNAGILIIMTRWHLDDLVGRLVKHAADDPRADQWSVLELPAIAGEGDDNPDDPRLPGEALWPSFKTAEEWERDALLDPAGFNALGQQRPVPAGGATFKTSWTEQRYSTIPAEAGTWVWSCDPKAGSKDPKSSRVVIQLWFTPHKHAGRAYLIDQVRGLWDQPETLAEFRRLGKLPLWRNATTKLVENKADGKAIVSTLKSEIPGLLLIEPQGDKVTRARAVTPYWAAGNVYLPADGLFPWVGEFVNELVTFPFAAHDDQVDAMALALFYIFVTDGNDPIEHLRRITGIK